MGNLKSNKKCPDELYGQKYDSLRTFCYKGEVYDLCYNKAYDPSNQFCNGGYIYSKCKMEGGRLGSYDVSKYGCFDFILYDNCDRIVDGRGGPCSYEDSLGISLRCKNKDTHKIVKPYPGMECAGDGKILGEVKHVGLVYDIKYKTVQIGEQVWIAENLYDDNMNDKYDWAKAMGLQPECNENPYYRTTCTGGLGQEIPCDKPRYPECETSPLYGLCPQGWRIPSSEDWQELVSYVGSGNIENYGFNAKFSTYIIDSGPVNGAYWWTSDAEGKRNTTTSYYIPNMQAYNANKYNASKWADFSVRCLRN